MMSEMEEEEAQPRESLEFVKTSILDTIVPLASNVNIVEALRGSVERLDEGHDSPLAAIPQRNALFFGTYPTSGTKICILLIRRC